MRLRKSFCVQGHPLTPENTVHYGGYPSCYQCRLNRNKEWLKRNPEKVRQYRKATWAKPEWKKYARNYWLVKTYGITLEQYSEILEKQGGVCAICKTAPTNPKFLGLDHDHSSGNPRGVLCRKCNSLLGHSVENIGILKEAIKYLETYALTRPQNRATASGDVQTNA